MDEDKPAAPPDGSLEGEVLNGEWRLGRLLARGDGGDVFAAKSELTGQRVTVWVLAPHLAQDPEIDRRVREAILKNPSVRYLETGEVRALGVTYVVLEDAVVLLPGGLDLAGAMREMLAAPQPTTESAPATPAPRMAAAGRDGSSEMLLVWLQDRRVAAASAGVAPFSPASMRRSAAPFASPAASPQAWAPSAAPAPKASRAPDASPKRSARRRGPHPAIWGSAAAIGVVLLGSTVVLQTSTTRPAPGPVASPGPEEDTTVATNAATGPVDSLQALVGSWAPRDGGCERALRLTVTNGRLLAQTPDGEIEAGDVERVEGAAVTVKTATGSYTYHVEGDTFVVTDAAGRTLDFSRCPASAAGNAAAVGGEAALIAMAVAGAGGAAPQIPPPILDEVDVSAFAPKRLRAGDSALVQIYLHLVDQADTVADRARAADDEARLRGQTTLGLELARGTRVDVMLDAGGLGVDEPIQAVVWRGRPCACQFAISAPADGAPGQHVLTARVLVDGVPLGRLGFSLAVSRDEAPAARSELAGESARRYVRAFLSYSSSDRPEVLKTAQTLRATGIDYFQDILSIEPGAEWRERLFAEIDRCDLFLLFWSSHAAGSDWVRQEAEYALARRRSSSEASPDIRPIILEGPPIPPPPASLASLHFNDMLRYVVVASELEAKARAAG